jgi:hypothetical protein
VLEYRDVIGSLHYANSRVDTRDMKTSLYSRCLGANSTIVAMNKHPEEFRHILAMIALQPAPPRAFVQRAVEMAQIENGFEIFNKALHRRSGYQLDDFRPIENSWAVTVPTLVAQVHDDFMMPTYRGSTTTFPLETRSSSGSRGRTFVSTDTTTSEITRS